MATQRHEVRTYGWLLPALAIPTGFAALGTSGWLDAMGFAGKLLAYLAFGFALLAVLALLSRRTTPVVLRVGPDQVELEVGAGRCACRAADLAGIALTHDGITLRFDLQSRADAGCTLFLGGLMPRADLRRLAAWLAAQLPAVPVTINGARLHLS